jgi:hypothetical protein
VSELRWPRRSVRSNDRCSLTRTDGKRGPNSHRATRAGTPALPLIRFRVLGPPFCGASAEPVRWVEGGAFQNSGLGVEPKERCPVLCRLRLRPATASVPRSRSIHCDELSGGVGAAKAVAECTCTTPLRSDQNRGEERAQFSSTAPCRKPRPSPHWFPSWARRSVGESRACAMGAGGAFKISAPRFRLLDKEDAVPMGRKADGGKCEGGPVGTTYRMS